MAFASQPRKIGAESSAFESPGGERIALVATDGLLVDTHFGEGSPSDPVRTSRRPRHEQRTAARVRTLGRQAFLVGGEEQHVAAGIRSNGFEAGIASFLVASEPKRACNCKELHSIPRKRRVRRERCPFVVVPRHRFASGEEGVLEPTGEGS